MLTIHDVYTGDLVVDPVYGRIEDIWIGNSGVWYVTVSGRNFPLALINKVIPREHLSNGKDGILGEGRESPCPGKF